MHAHLDKAAEATKLAVMSKIFHERDSNDCVFWGVLHIKIIQCKNLRNLDRLGLTSLITKRKRDKSDPYVTAFIGDYRLLKTKFMNDDLSPVFNEEFVCPVAHVTDNIAFKVFDKDTLKDESLGKYFLPASELISLVDEKDMQADPKLAPYDLKRVGLHKTVFLDGKKHYGTLEFTIEFIPTRMLAKTMEVPGIYFKKTIGNDVKLYVNADDDGSAPIVKYGGVNDDAKIYTPPRLWRDIYDAICNAKYFIYVAGWSIDTSQYMLRGEELRKTLEKGKYSPRIGDLLKSKADEGVVVDLMQWDDYTSNRLLTGMNVRYIISIAGTLKGFCKFQFYSIFHFRVHLTKKQGNSSGIRTSILGLSAWLAMILIHCSRDRIRRWPLPTTKSISYWMHPRQMGTEESCLRLWGGLT